MTIDKKLENGTLRLAVAGRLDTNTAPELEAEINTDGLAEIDFDFSALDYISSAGLRVLMTAHKAMAASGGAMKILHPNAMVKGVFDITGLGDIFTVEE